MVSFLVCLWNRCLFVFGVLLCVVWRAYEVLVRGPVDVVGRSCGDGGREGFEFDGEVRVCECGGCEEGG